MRTPKVVCIVLACLIFAAAAGAWSQAEAQDGPPPGTEWVTPPGLQGRAVTPTSIEWTWSPSVPTWGGIRIVGYIIGDPDPNAAPITDLLPPTTTSFTEVNLQENAQYHRLVLPIWTVDTYYYFYPWFTPGRYYGGPASATVSKYTLVIDPTLEDFAVVYNSTTNGVSVVVTPPPNSTAGQTGVEITYRDGNGLDTVIPFSNIYAPPDVTNLIQGMTYTVRIQFRNGDGDPTWISYGKIVLVPSSGTIHSEPSELDGSAWVPAFPGGSVNVVPVNGKLQYELDLFSTQGLVPTQSFSLTYNSRDPGARELAPGWTMNYLTRVEGGALTNQLTWVLPNGVRLPVQLDESGNGEYANHGFACSVEKQAESWNVNIRNGMQFRFAPGGALGQIMAPTGNYIDISTEEGKIRSVRDQIDDPNDTGRTTQILYQLTPNDPVEDHIRVVIDPAGRRYEFYYDGLYLTSVVFASDPHRPTYTFTYGSNRLLSQVLPPEGSAANPQYGYSVFYDVFDRVEHVEDPSVKYLLDSEGDDAQPDFHTAIFRVSYNSMTPGVTGNCHTSVENRRASQAQNPLLYTTIYTFDSQHQFRTTAIWDPTAIAVASDPARTIFPVTKDYDAYQNVIAESDRWGKTTYYTYVTSPPRPWMKNLVEKVERPAPEGDGREEVESFTYYPNTFGSLWTHTTRAKRADTGVVESRTTTYTYNDYNQMTLVTYPGVTRPNVTDQGTVYTEYVYNGPRKALSRVYDEERHYADYLTYHPIHCLPLSVLREGGAELEETQYDIMGNVTGTRRPKGGSEQTPDWTVIGLDNLYRVHTVKDPLGQVTTNEYDRDSNLISVQPPLGLPTTTVFDHRGLVSGGTTPDGLWHQYVDANGNVRRKATIRGVAYGYTTNTYFDSLDRAIETRVPGASLIAEGGGGPTMVTKWVHDGFDGTDHFSTVTQVEGETGRVTKTIFDNRGRAKQVLAADDEKTKTENFYDEQDQLVATQVFYKEEGQYVFQTCTVTLRDERDRVYCTRVQNAPYPDTPNQHSDTYTLYNKAGFVWRTVDPLGSLGGEDAHTTTFVPDIRGRVWKVKDGYGVTVKENIYGNDDLLIAVMVPDPATKSTTLVTAETRSYTARKELKTVKNRDGKGITNTYTDIQGQIDTMTDAFGVVTKTTYYANTLRVDEVIEAQGTANERRTKNVWQNGLLSETRVWNPATLSYNSSYFRYYDQSDRLERYEAPLVAAERYFYNAFGEQNKTIIGSKTVDHTFNALGQRTDSEWSGAYTDQETRTYNRIGLTETVSWSSGSASKAKTMYYDTWLGTPNAEVFSVGPGVWKLQNHGYDVARNYVQFTDAESRIHEWKYDDNNRVYETWYGPYQNVSKINNVTFTPGGLVDKTTLRDAAGNAIAETTMTYDGLGRKARQQTVQISTNTVVADLEWGYNDLDLVTSIKFHHLGAEVTLGYNERRELTSEVLTGNGGGQTPPPYTNQIGDPTTGHESLPSNDAPATPHGVTAVANRSATYDFDPAGNRTSQTIDGLTTTFTHNAASQLKEESVSGQTVYHHYDEWGNEKGRGPDPDPEKPTEAYGYNYLNLMSSYIKKEGTTVVSNWQYDFWPTGERYAKTNVTTNLMEIYVTRAGDVATEYDKPDGGAITYKNTYVQGIGIDQKQTRISSSLERRHYIGDQVGTVDVTLTDAGAVAESGLKDAWGVQLAGGTLSERYGFAQREHDTESGLVHMRARMYDPKLGRFTQTDPIMSNRPIEHYVYVSNRPIALSDPLGLDVVGELGDEWRKELLADAYSSGSPTYGFIASLVADVYEALDGVRSGEAVAEMVESKAALAQKVYADERYHRSSPLRSGFQSTLVVLGTTVIPSAEIYSANQAVDAEASIREGRDVEIDALGVLENTAGFTSKWLGFSLAAAKGLDAIKGPPVARPNPAHNAANYEKLKKSLASEQQVGEAGTTMAGPEARVPFRDAARVAKDYGGEAGDWVKKTSSSYTAADGTQFETHWVENVKTGQRVEYKTKLGN